MEYQKDYNLLRPFDLEAAKRVEKICWFKNEACIAEYIGTCGMNDENDICVKWLVTFESVRSGEYVMHESCYFRMAPLAWVEGRPVYKGDVLYNTYFNQVVTITGEHVSSYSGGQYLATDTATGANSFVASLTWEKPKTKRKGWMNCYPDGNNYVYPIKEVADRNAVRHRTSCIEIEWEE